MSTVLSEKQQKFLEEAEQALAVKTANAANTETISYRVAQVVISLVVIGIASVHLASANGIDIPSALMNVVGFTTILYTLLVSAVVSIMTMLGVALIFYTGYVIDKKMELAGEDREMMSMFLDYAIDNKNKTRSIPSKAYRLFARITTGFLIISLAANSWYLCATIMLCGLIFGIASSLVAKDLDRLIAKALSPTERSEGDEG